jgi:hypothetical protein
MGVPEADAEILLKNARAELIEAKIPYYTKVQTVYALKKVPNQT